MKDFFLAARDYIGWWILIPACLILLLQVSGCVEISMQQTTKRIEIMSAHCASQGKTFLQTGPDGDKGACI